MDGDGVLAGGIQIEDPDGDPIACTSPMPADELSNGVREVR
jgi:hypothetical protein